MKQIKKAVIPAAGLGTRFLPATKAQPKEMLPIVDKPTIQYIVEEAVASGIEDIIIISGRNKRAIEDHFDKSYELEATLAEKEKYDLLEQIKQISNLANIHYIRQKEACGLGDAILCAKRFIGEEPFAVLLGDIIINSKEPALQQLIKLYDDYKTSIIGIQKVEHQDVSKYGIVGVDSLYEGVYSINSLVEKPAPDQSPSQFAILGRYIFTPNIFNELEQTLPGRNDEVQLTDALQAFNKANTLLAHVINGDMYDIGDKFGFIKATIDYALEHEDIHDKLRQYIREHVEESELKIGE